MHFFKKLGQVLFSILPFIIVLCIQLILMIPFVVFTFAYSIMESNSKSGFNLQTLLNQVSKITGSVPFNTAFFLVFSSTVILLFGYWYISKFERPRNTLQKSLRSAYWHPLMVLGIIVLSAGLLYVSTYVMNFVSMVNPEWMHTFENMENSLNMDHLSIGLAIYAVLLGPINEEIIFRGLTLGYAKKALPFWAANILQALLFGLYHMNMIQGCYAFVIGLFFGYIREKGGSLIFSICLHIIYNLFATFANGILFFGNQHSVILNCIWVILAVLLPLLGLFLYTKGVNKRAPMPVFEKVEKKKKEEQIPYI